jgi:hypothetical protein
MAITVSTSVLPWANILTKEGFVGSIDHTVFFLFSFQAEQMTLTGWRWRTPSKHSSLRENVALEVGLLLFHTSGAPRTNATCALSILAANIREKPVGSHSVLAVFSGALS